MCIRDSPKCLFNMGCGTAINASDTKAVSENPPDPVEKIEKKEEPQSQKELAKTEKKDDDSIIQLSSKSGKQSQVNEKEEVKKEDGKKEEVVSLDCLLYTSPSPRDLSTSRMPSSA
eukprot:TRINITY_DN12467_c0_g1_i2.p2 TRINITY_DN12467_c0_g1~~TRINITY_DN12467_c0_g1_i2.p2  ORF type:complete len:116 (+),score=38.92 TRINITY_DN12467_c0_g1_i2:130-477(+)